jgi:hypothetical protein
VITVRYDLLLEVNHNEKTMLPCIGNQLDMYPNVGCRTDAEKRRTGRLKIKKEEI